MEKKIADFQQWETDKLDDMDRRVYDLGESLESRLDLLEETTNRLEKEVRDNAHLFRVILQQVQEKQMEIHGCMTDFRDSVERLAAETEIEKQRAREERDMEKQRAREERDMEKQRAREERDMEKRRAQDEIEGEGRGAEGKTATEVESVSSTVTGVNMSTGTGTGPEPVAESIVTVTTLTPINSQDDAQATTAPPTSPTATTILPTASPPATAISPPMSPLTTTILPPTSPSTELSTIPPSLIVDASVTDDPVGDRLSPGNTAEKGKRGRGKPPNVGDRRSPRLRGNSRAPSPGKDGTSKRLTEEDIGGDPKRRKVVPS
jgi:hypothetical protein